VHFQFVLGCDADLALTRSTVGARLALIGGQSLRLVQQAPAFAACLGGRQSRRWWLRRFRANLLPHLRFEGVVTVAAEIEVFAPSFRVVGVHLMSTWLGAAGPVASRPSHGAIYESLRSKRSWKSASAVDICPSKAMPHLRFDP